MMLLSDGGVQLRAWLDGDLAPFTEMNTNPMVRPYAKILTMDESRRLMDRHRIHLAEQGFGVWVLALPGITHFAGLIGLQRTSGELHFTPCVEVGWSLKPAYWGKGYGTEGARLALQFGFEHLGLDEIVAYTVARNLPSCRVMERLGMSHDPADDFDHPSFADGDPLRPHVLYRLRRDAWRMENMGV